MMVSVVGAMRGRFEAAITGIDSLIHQADDLKNVEFVFRFDDDDKTTAEKIYNHYADKKDLNMKLIVGERHGYIYMNKYWDECVLNCSGEYVLTWTDDMIMSPNNTKGWDTSVREFKNQFFILEFSDTTYPKWPCGVVFPKKLFEILNNRLCPNLLLDRWIIEILKENDIWVILDKNVTHNHAWSGKGPRDNTFMEGRKTWDNLDAIRYTMSDNGYPDYENWDENDFNLIKQYLKDNPNDKDIETDKLYFGRGLDKRQYKKWFE